jgi:hypothetical protein
MKGPRVCAYTVIDSGLKVLDLDPPEEMDADRKIVRLHKEGKLKLVTTAMTRREQERTTDPDKREKLIAEGRLSVVHPASDVIDFEYVFMPNNRGMIANPIVTDIVHRPVCDKLREVGLKDADAMHVMYAINSKCDVFLNAGHQGHVAAYGGDRSAVQDSDPDADCRRGQCTTPH